MTKTPSSPSRRDPTRLAKRSILVAGHHTSLTLEDLFWEALKEIAAAREISVNALITEIDAGRTGNLSSAVRVFILQQMSGADG
jgi:predicted DNA-binding ribbon-helix-helix protein